MRSYELPHNLGKNNVMDYLEQIQQQLTTASQLEVDCHQVTQIDSAGIALLIELTNLAKTKAQLKLTNLSPSILNMCALYQIKL